MAGATGGGDNRRWESIPANKKIRGGSIACEGPIPELREVCRDHTQEGTAVHGVKGIPNIKRNINPVRVFV